MLLFFSFFLSFMQHKNRATCCRIYLWRTKKANHPRIMHAVLYFCCTALWVLYHRTCLYPELLYRLVQKNVSFRARLCHASFDTYPNTSDRPHFDCAIVRLLNCIVPRRNAQYLHQSQPLGGPIGPRFLPSPPLSPFPSAPPPASLGRPRHPKIRDMFFLASSRRSGLRPECSSPPPVAISGRRVGARATSHPIDRFAARSKTHTPREDHRIQPGTNPSAFPRPSNPPLLHP